MRLVIDIGNSRIKWALFENTDITGSGAFHNDDSSDARWRRLFETSAGLEAVIIGSVGPTALRQHVEDAVRTGPNIALRIVKSSERAFGVTNGYDCPERLGVDRWAAIVGAWTEYEGGVCIVDCGSAVTIDAVETDGRHIGGQILPGLRLMQNALGQGTAAVKEGGPIDRGAAWGTATEACVAAGVNGAVMGAIELAYRDLVQIWGKGPRLLLTGGDAVHVAQRLRVPVTVDPHLVLKGLLALADEYPRDQRR